MSESDILVDVLVAVTALPDVCAWRNNSGLLMAPNGRRVRAGVEGSPDIIGVHRGRGFGIEVKTPVGRQSPAQRRFQAAWERAGGMYILARSADAAVAALT